MNIIGKKYIFLTFSGLMVVASILAVSFFGLKQGIDFIGGSLWQIRFEDASLTSDLVKNIFKDKLKIDDASIVSEMATKSFLVRLKEISEVDHQKYLLALNSISKVEELKFESLGPLIGSELRQKAVCAFIFVLF